MNNDKLYNNIVKRISESLQKILVDDYSYDYKTRKVSDVIQLNNKILNEEYHEISETDDIISYIISLADNSPLNTPIYSSYVFSFNKQDKPKYKFIKQSIDIQKYHPIYVIFQYIEDDSIYGEIEMRQVDNNNTDYNTDPIYIYINTYNKDFLQYTLKHELTHVVNMFSAYRHNNIMSLKNTVGYDDNDLQLNPSIYNKVMRMLYIVVKTEQDAHLNALAEYMNNLSDNEKHDILNFEETTLFKKIFNFITNNKTISQLTQIPEFRGYIFDMEHLLEIGDYSLIFYIGYYLQKHHIIWLDEHIDRQFILNYKKEKFNNMFNRDYDNIAIKIYQIYSSNIYKYQKKIFDMIYHKLI